MQKYIQDFFEKRKYSPILLNLYLFAMQGRPTTKLSRVMSVMAPFGAMVLVTDLYYNKSLATTMTKLKLA